MKKKIFAMTMAAAMAISMTACGGAQQKTEAPKAETKTEEVKEEAKAEEAEAPKGVVADVNGDGKIVVGYISKNLTDPFQCTINVEAESRLNALLEEGVIDEFTGLIDGKTDPSFQINAANDCISMGCDFVFILPAESAASDPAVTQMAEAGVNVIVINAATVNSPDYALGLCQSDDVYAGELMATYVNEKCPEGGKYLHCQGVIGNSAQIQRGEGIANAIADNLESVGDAPCDWVGAKATDAASDALAKYGDELVAVICDNDDMSSAVQSYCNSAGREDMICVGVDGNAVPLEMIANGTLGATVLQDGAGQIGAGVDLMLQVINGEEVPEHQTIMVPFVLITAENVEEYR